MNNKNKLRASSPYNFSVKKTTFSLRDDCFSEYKILCLRASSHFFIEGGILRQGLEGMQRVTKGSRIFRLLSEFEFSLA